MESVQGQSELADEHELLLRQRHACYLGSAKIPLRNLDVRQLEIGGYTLSEPNVRRLLEVFRQEGVQRLEPENFVPVIVPRAALDAAVQQSQTTVQALHEIGHLPLLQVADDVQFRVLHGQHRLRAAEQFLMVEDGHWWCAEIYSTGSSDWDSSFHDRTPLTRG
jgi:hypothetical protein